jgi:hypothetical protein
MDGSISALITVIYLKLLFLCWRGWLAALILGIFSILFGLINYIKNASKRKPFLSMGFQYDGRHERTVGFTSITIPWQDIALIIFVFIIVFCPWFSKVTLPRSPWYRIIGGIILAETANTDRSAYMSLLLDYYAQVSSFDIYLQMEPTPTIESLYDMCILISHDMILGEKYADQTD